MTSLQGLHGVPKVCTFPGCGVVLDSENRYGHNLLCKPHGRERDRERHASKPTGKARAPKRFSKDPERNSAHQALGRWLALPLDHDAQERLRALLVDYELRHRLRLILPDAKQPHNTPKANPGIPLEDPEFTNPDHRTTRPEFLSECDSHGV